jgi:hypothetical protein
MSVYFKQQTHYFSTLQFQHIHWSSPSSLHWSSLTLSTVVSVSAIFIIPKYNESVRDSPRLIHYCLCSIYQLQIISIFSLVFSLFVRPYLFVVHDCFSSYSFFLIYIHKLSVSFSFVLPLICFKFEKEKI